MLNNVYSQVATYWADTGSDYEGGRTFAEPVLLNVRWLVRGNLKIYIDNELKLSKAIVHTQEDVVVGGYFALGDLTEHADADTPNIIPEANIILDFKKTQAISTVDIIRKAFLYNGKD